MEPIVTESSWEEYLGEAHISFMLSYVEQAQLREEAVLNDFLEDKDS